MGNSNEKQDGKKEELLQTCKEYADKLYHKIVDNYYGDYLTSFLKKYYTTYLKFKCKEPQFQCTFRLKINDIFINIHKSEYWSSAWSPHDETYMDKKLLIEHIHNISKEDLLTLQVYIQTGINMDDSYSGIKSITYDPIQFTNLYAFCEVLGDGYRLKSNTIPTVPSAPDMETEQCEEGVV